ncbi:MAG: hypothetical protein WCO78_04290 [Candidatus Roizmanbacteria bacterium]
MSELNQPKQTVVHNEALKQVQASENPPKLTRRSVIFGGVTAIGAVLLAACAPAQRVVSTLTPDNRGKYVPRGGFVFQPESGESDRKSMAEKLVNSLNASLGIPNGTKIDAVPLDTIRAAVAKLAEILPNTPYFPILLDQSNSRYAVVGSRGEINPVAADGTPASDKAPRLIESAPGNSLFEFNRDGIRYCLVGYGGNYPAIDTSAWESALVDIFKKSEAQSRVLHVPRSGYPSTLYTPNGLQEHSPEEPPTGNVFARSASILNRSDITPPRTDMILNPAYMKVRGAQMKIPLLPQIAQSLADEMITIAAVEGFQSQLVQGNTPPELNQQYELASSTAGWSALMSEYHGLANPFIERDTVKLVTSLVA